MMTMAAVPTRTARSCAVPPATRRPSLPETLRSELTKITSVRSTGYGTGALIRHTAAAITAILGVMFLIPLLAQALPTSWYRDIMRRLPGGSALSPIASSTPPLSHDLFSAWGESGVFCGYAAVLLAVGAWPFSRRDA
jgi:ABC-2 type transport system permease protein